MASLPRSVSRLCEDEPPQRGGILAENSSAIIYSWMVFVHFLGAFGFVLARGASAFAAFRVRREQDPHRIAAMLDLSNASMRLMYYCVALLIAAGVGAGLIGHWFGKLWIWAAIGVLVVVSVAMFAYATPYYIRVRLAVGQPDRRSPEGSHPVPAPPVELAALLESRRPEGLAAIGGIGPAVLIWLMTLKPF
jgi:hypothetical protein